MPCTVRNREGREGLEGLLLCFGGFCFVLEVFRASLVCVSTWADGVVLQFSSPATVC